MKVLYVATISNTINAFLIPHIKFLIEEGNQVDIMCNIVREINPELIKLGCKIHNIEFQRSPINIKNYIAYKKIKKLVLLEGYKIVHTHTPVASFLTRLACRKFSNVKVLYTTHGFHFYKGAPFKNWFLYYTMEMIAARFTDGLITINEEDYLNAKKMKLRKNNSVYKMHGVGIDLNNFSVQTEKQKSELRKDYGFKEDDVILFCIAELNYNKHQDLLINVVNILKNKVSNIKLLIASVGSLKEHYEEQVKKLGIENNVYFLGHRKDIPNLLKICDIVVSASRREGLPVSIMEAMSTGLPLVVTDCRGNRDLISNGENGFVVGINDAEDFADAVEKLYKSEELRHKFGHRNLELIKSYSLESVLNEIKGFYSNYI